MFQEIIKKILFTKNYIFTFFASVCFYYFLWFVNPSNKIIVVLFTILLVIFYVRLKDFKSSLLITYFVSMVIFTGKTYYIQLIPAGLYPEQFYPNGYVVPLIISYRHILAFFLLIILSRDLYISKFKIIVFSTIDIILIGYYIWIFISDIFASYNPGISFLFSLTSLDVLILYFYIRAYYVRNLTVIRILLWVFVAITLFQSTVAFQQFLNNSPVFKNIEHQVDFTEFGLAVDELKFRFRPLGTFPHANILASWLSFFLSLLLIQLLKKRDYFLLTVFVIGDLVLVMSLSRSAWIGTILSIILIYFFCRSRGIKLPTYLTKHLLGMTMLFITLFIFFILPRLQSSIYTFAEGIGGGNLRIEKTLETIDLILQNPLLGVGTSMTVQEGIKLNPRGVFSQAPLTVHNWYLLLASEHGIPALFFFFIFLIL